MVYYKSLLALQKNSRLGEGIFWHSEHKKIYWIDIENMEVHRFDPETLDADMWNVGKRVGCIVPSANDKIVCALQGEIAELDLLTGKTKKLLDIEKELPGNRCNDGNVDLNGRLWIGTMSVNEEQKEKGSLYRIGPDLIARKMVEKLSISNGIGWSPNDDEMYLIDTPDKRLLAFRYDAASGNITNERRVDFFPGTGGFPDGMCMDTDGMLWIAFWGGKRIGRFDPATGDQLAEVEVPAVNITSCCFGDDDLQTLYIITARQGMSEEELKEYPLSGSIFKCKPGVGGVRMNSFKY
jgi:sugar lactone lactonase YvrE